MGNIACECVCVCCEKHLQVNIVGREYGTTITTKGRRRSSRSAFVEIVTDAPRVCVCVCTNGKFTQLREARCFCQRIRVECVIPRHI